MANAIFTSRKYYVCAKNIKFKLLIIRNLIKTIQQAKAAYNQLNNFMSFHLYSFLGLTQVYIALNKQFTLTGMCPKPGLNTLET
jgi:5-bromo-4-chloroindolyl phosphate hydrolysis protein